MIAISLTASGAVRTITISRPETRNALSNEVLGAIAATLDRVEAEPNARCIVTTGSDTVFASGADLQELADQEALDAFLGARGDWWRRIRETRLPVVAAVSGYCLGGGFELAMAADLVVADPGATFGLPETALGLVPGAGGSRALTATAGPKLAADVTLTGRRLNAEEALANGVVSRTSEPGQSVELAHSLAQEIASRPRAALVLAKRALVEARESLEGLASDRAAFHLALGAPETKERIADFLARQD